MGSEKELREMLDTHRGDTSLYSSKPARVRPAQRPSAVFSIRLSAAELEALQAIATERHTTITGLVRDAVAQHVRGGQHLFVLGEHTGSVTSLDRSELEERISA